jgi:hypothetical protein
VAVGIALRGKGSVLMVVDGAEWDGLKTIELLDKASALQDVLCSPIL